VSRPTPGEFLVALAGILEARKLPGVELARDRRGPRWLVVDGEIVAHVHGEAVLLCAVRDGLKHDEYVVPETRYTPRGDAEEAERIAMEIELRIAARSLERAKLAAPRLWQHALQALAEEARAKFAASGPPPEPPLPFEEDGPAASCEHRVSVAGCLEQAEATSGLRGRYSAQVVGQRVHVTWTPGDGSRTDVVREALDTAVRVLVSQGYAAARAPGWPLVVVNDAAALIGADEPGRDHEHGRDTARPAAE